MDKMNSLDWLQKMASSDQQEAPPTPAAAAPILPTTAREMLDLIDQFFVAQRNGIFSSVRNEGAKLWDVLSALRGPDEQYGANGGKLLATIPVRRAAFPQTARLREAAWPGWASFTALAGPLKNAVQAAKEEGMPRHFIQHIARAVAALTGVNADA